MNAPLIRKISLLFVIFGVGFIAGQVTFSLDQRAKEVARRVSLVEGVVGYGQKETARRLEQLAAIGYVDGTYDRQSELRGVLVHDRERTCPGVNFYSSRIRTEARLIDNDGVELHSWSFPGDDGWEHAELLPDGHVLVVVNGQGVLKLDLDSELEWRYETSAHHDLAVRASTGDIYALANERHPSEDIHPDVDIIEDIIVVLDPDGRFRERISILDMMRRSPYAFLLASPQHLPSDLEEGENLHLDLLHTNHIQVLDGSLADRSPLFREGNILLSMRTINTIVIADPRTRQVLWAWGPTNLYRQHHPTLLANGHILIFDNGRRRSQIVELDPLSLEVVWRYAPERGFLSQFRGSVQRLPNGNTLITESDKGYVFEVTPDGDTVWQFANPDVNQDKNRIAIWRMTRYPREALGFLD